MMIPELVGAGIIVVGAGYGLSKIGSSAMEAMARQPEVASQINTSMIIIGALLEGVALAAIFFGK
ncbi:MAG: ATP synthase F0 subunit C [Tenacibaculum sp.]|nr:ATP synthase F0 subunit C [Tenacibaculum sp.]